MYCAPILQGAMLIANFFPVAAPYGASTTVGRLPAGARAHGLLMDPHGTLKSSRSGNQMRQKVGTTSPILFNYIQYNGNNNLCTMRILSVRAHT